MSFKAGDRVRYIGSTPGAFAGEWEIVAVSPPSADCKPIMVVGYWPMQNPNKTASLSIVNLELVTLKNGDRVKYTGPSIAEFAGEWEVVIQSSADHAECKPINLTGSHSIDMNAVLKLANLELISSTVPVTNTCTCSIPDLMSQGCKCGQMEREKK